MPNNTFYDFKDYMIYLEECADWDDGMDPICLEYIDDHQNDDLTGSAAFETDGSPDEVELLIMLNVECGRGK